MNPDLVYNPITQPQIYQQIYLNWLFQQQQMIQYMISQQQCPTMCRPDIKIEYGQQQDQIQCPIVSIPTEREQSHEKIPTELDQLTNNKENLEDDDSQPRVNGSHWTKQEHQLYLQFVRDHEDILRSKYDKKSKKVFKLMSQYIPSRTATQCRSHHQKFNPLAKGKRKQKLIPRSIPTIIPKST